MWWEALDYERLLDVRLCDLDLRIEDTALAARVERLYGDLERRGLRFRPNVWLSSDWFSPDRVPGFAIPFFLAHRRLARIEHRHMLEVEGGSHTWCMKLMRHETGHAIDNAYKLHHRRGWSDVFGKFSQPYHDTYRPKPDSKAFVQNLDYWYSQSHPAEDWAECFAVWLQPGSRWRQRYAGWPVLAKLEYVDTLMERIATQPATVRTRRRVDSLPRLTMTLREYYERKQRSYQIDADGMFDEHLHRLFGVDRPRRPAASAFLRRHRHYLRTRVASVTGEYRYVVDQALREMIAGCRRHGLRLAKSERQTRADAAILLASLTVGLVAGRRREFTR